MKTRLLILLFLGLAWFVFPEIVFAESISVEGQNVLYEISSGQISSITINPITRELVVNVQSEEDGKLTITIPRSLLDSKLQGTDDVFYVIKNGIESSYDERDFTDTTRTIVISVSKGSSEIRIMGTESAVKTQTAQITQNQIVQNQEKKGGCLVATASFGTELSPQVQLLREVRDNVLFSTPSGIGFMSAFNSFYYSFSPTVSDWERQNPIFKEAVKITITPLIATLSILNYVDVDSEAEMLGYGIGVILLNISMYFVAPAFVIIRLKQSKK